jgi:hypothetical protein
MDFMADGVVLFSDYFWLTPVVTQYDYWNITVDRSSSPHIHGSLRVVIQPSNVTWSYYSIYMPYASNVTAHEYSTMLPLVVTFSRDSEVIVNLGRPRRTGYSFVIGFDVSANVLRRLGEGNYVIIWKEYPWERNNDIHRIRETYNITLPNQVVLLDVVGYNSFDLSYTLVGIRRTSLIFATNVTAQQFGWNILYRDTSITSPLTTSTKAGILSAPMLPILPINVGSLSIWMAVMSVFLLMASELVSPIYSRRGYRILIDRKRLRIAALILVALFMVTVAYQLTAQTAIIQH